MRIWKRLGAVPALAGLVAASALFMPAIASADPSDVGKEVVSVTPVERPSAEELEDGLVSAGDRTVRIAEDGSLLVFDDADYTSDASTRRIGGSAVAQSARPSSFDLRDAAFNGASGSFVTSIKSQNPFGACWAFGAVAGAETSILTETGTPVTEAGDPIDLSEKQLAWFSMVPLADDDPSGQGGEGTRTNIDASEHSGWLYSFGGSDIDATALFAMGSGPVDEAESPLLTYANAAGDYTDEYDYAEPSPDGDWSLPESLRFASSYELEESFSLPSPASFEPDPEDPSLERYVYNPEGVEAIKDQLLAGRAVGIGFCSDASKPHDEDEFRYLDLDTYAHYTYESPREGAEGGLTNHFVCIVGYDDGYSRENFLDGHEPPADGAFIVKNSWGSLDSPYGNQSDWGIDGSGYFYLSYYDKSIGQCAAYDFVTEADDDLAYGPSEAVSRHQYSFTNNSVESIRYKGVVSMANVFAMDEPSLVRTVSLTTSSFGARVRFDLYRLREGAVDPTDGELVWSRDETFPLGGFHRVELEAPLAVDAGERLGLVCTVKLDGNRSELAIPMDPSRVMAEVDEPDPDWQVWSEVVVNPGESFYGSPERQVEYSDGSYAYEGYAWHDLAIANAEEIAAAEAVLDEAGADGLIAARDAAWSAWTALDETDPGYEGAKSAYRDAQSALSEAIGRVMGPADMALYTQDNFPVSLTTIPWDPSDVPQAPTVDVLRLYNPNSGEHLYTTSAAERMALVEGGWKDEGGAWVAPARSNTPVWRLYNPNSGEHLYTASSVERSALRDLGWKDEGVAFHSENGHTLGVFRLFNPNATGVGAHHFTTSQSEHDACVRNGWRSEGVAWYGR